MTTAQILKVTDATLLDDCIAAAKRQGMHLITNGRRTVISPVIPAGWVKVAVKVKTPKAAHLETTPCAA